MREYVPVFVSRVIATQSLALAPIQRKLTVASIPLCYSPQQWEQLLQ